MWSLLVIASIIIQSAVAIYLLNGVRTGDDIDKHLRAMLIILLVHLSTKFLLLAVLKDQFLYAQLPTGFSLAYGPLLLIIARGILGKPVQPRSILFQFIPFLAFTLVYILLVSAGAAGVIARPAILGYVRWYQWLVLASLYGYPIYVKLLLRGNQTKKSHLVNQIANILLLGISAGFVVSMLERKANAIPGFDLRLLPYICFAAIPVFMLRYRLQTSAGAEPDMSRSIAETQVQDTNGSTAEMLVPGTTRSTGEMLVPGPTRSTEETQVPGKSPSTIETPAPETTRSSAETLAPEVEHPAADVPVHEMIPAVISSAVAAADRRYEKSGLDAGKMDEYEATLGTYMRKSKIYLDPDLSLEGLASRMKMSKHHLTQLLNERVAKNFYNFINEYRIEEAVDRLNNTTLQVNILSLAFDCGFNSRSSFNSYFKKITGHTPSAYRKIQVESRPARAASGETRNAKGQTGRKIIRDTSPSA